MIDKLESNDRFYVAKGKDEYYGDVKAIMMFKDNITYDDVIERYNIEEILKYDEMDVYESYSYNDDGYPYETEVYYEIDLKGMGLKYEDLSGKMSRIRLVSFEKIDGTLIYFQKRMIDDIIKENRLGENLFYGVVTYMDNELLAIIDRDRFSNRKNVYLLCSYILDEEYHTKEGLNQINEELKKIEIVDGNTLLKELDSSVERITKEIKERRTRRTLDGWIPFSDNNFSGELK